MRLQYLCLLAALAMAGASCRAGPTAARALAERPQWISKMESTPPQLPARRERARDPERVVGPFDRPLEAVTVGFQSQWVAAGQARGHRHSSVARTKNVVHVRGHPGAGEWYARRNPVAPARVSAVRIEHGSRLLLGFTDAELAMAGLPSDFAGWALLGPTPKELAALTSDGRVRTRFGVVFHCLVAEEAGNGLRELWWNRDLALPLLAVRVIGGVHMERELISLRRGVDAARIREPSSRLATYRYLDIVDWREEGCGCAGSGVRSARIGSL